MHVHACSFVPNLSAQYYCSLTMLADERGTVEADGGGETASIVGVLQQVV